MSTITKTELMQGVIEGRGHECFDHSDLGRFDITVMRELSKMLASMGIIERIKTLIGPVCDNIRATRDFELARLDDLPAASWCDDPGLIILMPNRESVIVDGTHRALRREREGLETMRFYSWPYPIAVQFARPIEGWGTPPGMDWGTPGFMEAAFASRKGENHD